MNLRGKLITAYLGLGSSCNLACRYCYRNLNCASDVEHSRFLPLPYVVRLAKMLQAAGHGIKCRVVLHGHEPLLAGNSYLRKVCAVLDEARTSYSLYVRTNGTVLDGRLLAFLGERRATVGVAIDGPEFIHDSLRAFRGGHGSLQRILRNVDILRNQGVRVLAFCVYTKQSLGHESAIFDFFHSRRLDFEFARVNISKAVAPQLWVSPLEAAGFHNRLFDLYFFQQPKRLNIGRIDRLIQRLLSSDCEFSEKACFDNGVFLDYDGFLYQCPGLAGTREHAIGHILNTDSLDGMFASVAAVEQRKSLHGIFRRCQRCELSTFCPGGCYYNALMEGTLPDDPTFCEFFSNVAPHVIERVYSSFQGAPPFNSKGGKFLNASIRAPAPEVTEA